MSFAMPPHVNYTKAVAGNTVTTTVQVQDANNANVGPLTTYVFDMTQTVPLIAWREILLNAIFQVQQNIAWSDMPASGALTIPTVDCIESAQ